MNIVMIKTTAIGMRIDMTNMMLVMIMMTIIAMMHRGQDDKEDEQTMINMQMTTVKMRANTATTTKTKSYACARHRPAAWASSGTEKLTRRTS